MNQIALDRYHGLIEGLLDENRLAEAATHCHFILQQHPRHVGTYRLFGRALLEQDYYRDAADIFERVLSADPADLISRAGLAIALREVGEIDQALWHMHRAFEIDPYNAAVRQELRDIVEISGDANDFEISLNSPALARLYARAGHFKLAIAETRRNLEKWPDRSDLLVFLAESLYWDGQRVAAASLSLELLRDLPDCLVANAIMAETLALSGRNQEAQVYIDRLKLLTIPTYELCNPETLLGRAMLSQEASDLPAEILVDELEYVAADVQEWEDAERWARGQVFSLPDDADKPFWLQEIPALADSDAVELELDEPDTETGLEWLSDLSQFEGTAIDPFEQPADVDDDHGLVEEQLQLNDELDGLEGGAEGPIDITDVADDKSVVEDDQTFPELLDLPPVDELQRILDGEDEKIPTLEPDPEAFPSYLDDDFSPFPGDLADDLADEDWYLDRETDLSDTDADSSAWLGELAAKEETDDDVPDWLYKAVGFTGELDAPEGFENPEWIDRSGQTGKLPEPSPDQQDLPKESLSTQESFEDIAAYIAETELTETPDTLDIFEDLEDDDAHLPNWLKYEEPTESFDDDITKDAVVDIDSEETAGSFNDQEDDIPWLDELDAQEKADAGSEESKHRLPGNETDTDQKGGSETHLNDNGE